jgi:hypothetical protein
VKGYCSFKPLLSGKCNLYRYAKEAALNESEESSAGHAVGLCRLNQVYP